eukprot:CAMPEP_0172658654 /NCGR_PEP_ID=MMETSP1074-20121228/2909_1 /TAXON_ID=2916 /ORGANISM="Ceratium fusus, Strain PA161109" /LENGTH=187 /DNA_ID=CAMNT_0013473979 /DNA_START=302 /DNA_END=865 /DNA_ORIENTATION=+
MRLSSKAAAPKPTKEHVLQSWRILPNGHFRGTLEDGLIVEFAGELLGPKDPGTVIGPGGIRYVLGKAKISDSKEDILEGMRQLTMRALAAAATATVAVIERLDFGLLQRWPANYFSGVSSTSVIKTETTIVETRRTLPDGSQACTVDKVTKKTRSIPGRAPTETSRKTRVEKILPRKPRARSTSLVP